MISYVIILHLQGSMEVIVVAAASVVTAVSDMAPGIVDSEFPFGTFFSWHYNNKHHFV
jgi:hypothetical protein